MKGEFLDQLKGLPAWNKTTYYCFAVELLEVATGRSLHEKSLEQLEFLANIKKAGPESLIEDNPGTFRLGKYQITLAADGQISWQAHEGMKRVGGGRCTIESGVLLIGRQELEEMGPSKQEFVDQLDRLPQWKRTGTWSHSAALRMCQPRQQEEGSSTTRPLGDTEGDRLSYEKHASSPYCGAHLRSGRRAAGLTAEPSGEVALFRGALRAEGQGHERSERRIPPDARSASGGTTRKALNEGSALGFKFGKPSGKPPRGRKVWLLWLIPLVLIGLVFGLISALHSVAKKLHWLRSRDEHHHRYKP